MKVIRSHRWSSKAEVVLTTLQLGASILFCISIAVVLIVLVPFIKSAALLVLVLTIWGISQAALFTVSHTRVMNAAESTPALGASLNISGANLGIALGAIVGGRMIDLFGLASVSAAAATIVAVAIAPRCSSGDGFDALVMVSS